MTKYERNGHRSRLRERYFEKGIDTLADAAVVELYLSTVIPRVDVKPVAYRLINHFDSLSDIFYADFDELAEIDGIGENTAVAIMMFGDLMDRVGMQFFTDLFEPQARMFYVRAHRFFGNKYCVVLLDKSGSLIENFDFTVYDPATKNALMEKLVKYNCPAVFVMRNGKPIILGEDVGFITEFKILTGSVGVTIADYVVGSGNDFLSITDTEHYKLIQK